MQARTSALVQTPQLLTEVQNTCSLVMLRTYAARAYRAVEIKKIWYDTSIAIHSQLQTIRIKKRAILIKLNHL